MNRGVIVGATTVYLGLGSSLGDREGSIRVALDALQSAEPHIVVAAVSSLYESPHMGVSPEDAARYPPHLNIVAQVETHRSPTDLLFRIHAVEDAGGRQRQERWGPRTIDIDILDFGGLKMESAALTLPHPGMLSRAFVLAPLAEIAPGMILIDGRTALEAANSLPDGAIRRVSELNWYVATP